MACIPLSVRVATAFDQATIEAYGQHYLDALLHNWRELAKSLRRSLIAVVALTVSFFLLRSTKHASIALGPFKLTDISAVLTIIPVLVTVLIYECTGIIMAFTVYRETVGELIKVMHPTVYSADLELMLVPATFSIVGAIGSSWEDIRSSEPGTGEALLRHTSTGIFIGILLGGLAFLVYSYVYLYMDTHANVIGVSFSLAATLLYALREIGLFLNYEAAF